ncbi:MAG: DUF3347 domain-containing protein [Spirosomataceae bacterium]
MKKNKSIAIALCFSFALLQGTYAQSITVNSEIKTSISKVLTTYYDLKNALVADDGPTASQQASFLMASLSKLPMEKMTEAQHALLMEFAGKIKEDAQYINDTKEVKKQRDHFNALSNALFSLVKGLHANENPVYQQYCPMKKVYWLSDNAAIKNPYYGKMMLTCGKVTETLQ